MIHQYIFPAKQIKRPIVLLFLTFIVLTINCAAQNIGLNTTGATPLPSAILDMNTGNVFGSGTSKGVLIPNVALTSATDATTIPSPAYSLLIFNTGIEGFAPAGYYYNAGTPTSPLWTLFTTGAGDWTLLGNEGTSPGVPDGNFIGTSDVADIPLYFGVADLYAGCIDPGNTNNTEFGVFCGGGENNGVDNSILGSEALISAGSASYYNVAVGANAGGHGNMTYDIFVGWDAGVYGGGNNNTIIGSLAGLSCTGNMNVCIGDSAGYYNQYGSYNTFIGRGANPFTGNVVNNSIGIGDSAIVYNSNAGFIGNKNLDSISTYAIVCIKTPQTTLTASGSGIVTFTEPFGGTSYKQIVIYLSGATGTATYTFPIAFTNTPGIVSTSTISSSVVTSLSNTSVTVTGTVTTGYIFLQGF